MKEKILHKFNLSDDKIINIYPFGSRVYNTASPSSDWDFWVISKNNVYSNLFAETRENISIHLYDENTFLEFLNQNKVSALECIYLPKELLFKYTKSFNFTLDIDKLQVNVKEKYRRDYTQAELRFKNDDLVGCKKAIFHGLRTQEFGNQILKHGKIVNYNMQSLWNKILEEDFSSWQEVCNKFKIELK
jgi:predicted nucleotidyltransferase